MNTAIN